MKDHKWLYKPLSALCGINLGNTPSRSKSEYWGKGYSWVSISDLKEKYISKTKEEITDVALAKSNCKIVKKGTLLMSFKLSIGKLSFAEKDLYTNEAIVALPIKDESELLKEYLYYVLKFIPLVGGNQAAMGQTLNKQSLSVLQIPIPPTLGDQQRIAKVLSQCEALIQKRKESIRLLDDLLRSTFLEMFGESSLNKKQWSNVPIKQFGAVITGNTPPRSNQDNYSSKHIEWIKTDNIRPENIYISVASEYLSETGLESARIANNGALLVACIAGSIESIGRAALTDRTVSFNQQINAIQPNEDVESLFLYWSFKVSRKYIQSHATKGMKKILTKGEFEKIKMIKPPLELQTQFSTIANKVMPINKYCQDSLKELENLYDSISQRVFNGELDLSKVDISDIEDSKKKDEKSVMEKEKQDITFMTLTDYLQIPEEIQMEEEGIELDFINDPLFYQFFLKNHFKDRSFLLQDVEGIFNKIYIPQGHDYNYESWKGYIFSELKSEKPKIEQLFDEESKVKQIKLKLTDEAFKA